MPFMHPWLFVGGAAAVTVPVIIHLLNRQRFKVIDWAAMRFIRESMLKNRRRIRLEELLLLLLRCLAIFLLAVAVGRFLGCGSKPLPVVASRAQTTHVFILDDSASMGQRLADTTSFHKAASDLAGMLEDIPAGDRVAVLRATRPGRAEAVFDLNTLSDAEGLGDRLRALKVSDLRADLLGAVKTARELFALTQTRKRLYLLSDFRRADYADVDFTRSLQAELRALRRDGVEIVLMNYGADPSANLTVEEIKVLNKLALSAIPLRVQVRVRNNGPRAAENVPVSFVLRDDAGVEAKLPARTINAIEPGETQLVQVSCGVSGARSVGLEAHLPGDVLGADNVGYLAVRVRQARRVLVVDGEPDAVDPTLSESFYLLAALDPNGDHGYGNEVKVVSPAAAAEENFDDYEVVILANVAELPATAMDDGQVGHGPLKALERYVRAGGGLVIFTGDKVNPTFYNGPFYNAGLGLCPLKLKAPVVDRTRRNFVRLLRDSIAREPVMRTYSGRRSEFTRFVRFYGYSPAEPAPPASAADIGPVRVLARFDNTDTSPTHSPAIVARAYGRGQVMMICSSADIEWSDWPKDFTFLPFINDVVEYLSRPGGRRFVDLVGRPIRYPLAADMGAAKASIQTPELQEDTVRLGDTAGSLVRTVVYDQTHRAGLYRLTLALPDETQTLLFARNVDPAEGRLVRATEQELRECLGVEFAYRDKLAGAPAGQGLAAERGEYWKAALVLMLIVLAAEVFLGQLFGHYK